MLALGRMVEIHRTSPSVLSLNLAHMVHLVIDKSRVQLLPPPLTSFSFVPVLLTTEPLGYEI